MLRRGISLRGIACAPPRTALAQHKSVIGVASSVSSEASRAKINIGVINGVWRLPAKAANRNGGEIIMVWRQARACA
jgi:hypothetical protein